jgi:predicted DNA-binding transcriptional regulator AlpA
MTDVVTPHCLIGDGEIAQLISLSKSWVRKQRFSRRHGLPHVLDIDPVMIGGCPRYPREEFLAWLERQKVDRNRSNGRAAQ